MRRYSVESRTGKYVKGKDFYHLQENMKHKYWIQDQMLLKR